MNALIDGFFEPFRLIRRWFGPRSLYQSFKAWLVAEREADDSAEGSL